MNLLQRIVRHGRIMRANYRGAHSPPFLVLFVNSICNMKCEHCFYWRSLNQRDDLTSEELVALSRSLGHIENLNLSGGEPFLRPDLGAICRQFVSHNGAGQIYVPTNGYYTDKTVRQAAEVLKERSLKLFVIELSLDGMAEFHDRFRVSPGAFDRAMKTYDALAAMQQKDGRLRIHAISTATNTNMDEIWRLTTYLFNRCPQMDHHNLAIIRGDRKNPSLQGPGLRQYEHLYRYIQHLWAPRETGRYGAIVEPMLQWAKVQTIQRRTQVVPCRAGRLSVVVYANGDVSVCELHKPLGNLRERTFHDIWNSPEAAQLRQSIARKDCHCTTEVFLWPSIVYQPVSLAKAIVGARVWRSPRALAADDRVTSGAASSNASVDR